MFNFKNKKAINTGENTSPLKSFELPSKEETLEDRIARAETTKEPFQYASVTGFSKETKKTVLAKLFASRPPPLTSSLSVDNLPIISLEDRKMSVSLAEILGEKKLKKMMNFIHLSEVRYAFSPTNSFYQMFGAVRIGIRDMRMLEAMENEVRSSTINGNNSGLITMSLDYCVGKKDIKNIELFIECENSPLKPGMVWGSLQVALKIVDSDSARPVELKATMGLLELPQGGLLKLKENPKHVDLTFDSDDLGVLRNMYAQGRILDQSKPGNKQDAIRFAGSVFGSDDGDKAVPAHVVKYVENTGNVEFLPHNTTDHNQEGSVYSNTESEMIRAYEAKKNMEANLAAEKALQFKGKEKEKPVAEEDHKTEVIKVVPRIEEAAVINNSSPSTSNWTSAMQTLSKARFDPSA